MELLSDQSLYKDEKLASMDVEKLFTNVPIRQTIDIIMDRIYDHPSDTPPKIPPNVMKKMLILCTQGSAFTTSEGDIYKQVDGVSMGSPLGPLFANTYMAFVEDTVLSSKPHLKPKLYCRYVDDIFMVVDSLKTLETLKNEMTSISGLQFTQNIERNKHIHFLDVNITKFQNNINTTVFVKPTSNGIALPYHRTCPKKYYESTIRGQLHRSFSISSTWEIFERDLQRIKQLFINNNYPAKLISDEIDRFIHIKTQDPTHADKPTNIKLHYRNRMSSDYKNEEAKLRKILHTDISPITSNKLIVNIYYQTSKLHNHLIRSRLKDFTLLDDHVVYQYLCPHGGCQSSNTYIGYTTCDLKQRFKGHLQNGSIRDHFSEYHSHKRRSIEEWLKSTNVLYRSWKKYDLIIAEAIHIKKNSPTINKQCEWPNVLKVF